MQLILTDTESRADTLSFSLSLVVVRDALVRQANRVGPGSHECLRATCCSIGCFGEGFSSVGGACSLGRGALLHVVSTILC